jgi:hypothetical protein
MRAMLCATAWAAALIVLLAPVPVIADHHEAGEAAESAVDEKGRKPWDQTAMTDLTARLADSTAALRRAFRSDPVFSTPENPNRRSALLMEDTLRNLQNSTRQLRNRVRDGGGFDETQGIARRIGMLLNDADVTGRRIMTTVWLADHSRPAMLLINEIAPYYGSSPLYDPETQQRLDRAPNRNRPPSE